jgi:hypothetical protein
MAVAALKGRILTIKAIATKKRISLEPAPFRPQSGLSENRLAQRPG